MQHQAPGESIFGNQLVRFLYEPAGASEQAAWQSHHDLLEQCQSHGRAAQTAAWAENILRQVQAFVSDDYLQVGPYARYQEDVRQASPYAGFTHEVSGERLSLHFTHTMDPDSPLRHPAQLRAGLGRLLPPLDWQFPLSLPALHLPAGGSPAPSWPVLLLSYV